MQGGSGGEYRSLGLRLYPSQPFLSYVFLKKHKSKEGEPVSHALYVTGLPWGLTQQHLQELFACFGEVQQVALHQTGRSGIVVFHSEEEVAAVLQASARGQILEYELTLPEGPLGLKSWVQQHKALRPGNNVLQKQLDDWVAAHEAAEEESKKAREDAMAEEGWTVVVRSKGRKRAREESGVSSMSGGVALAAAQAAGEQAAAGKKELGNFYRFQQRDKRRNELLELRKKFEEDRRRVVQLRAARNFKPQ